MSDRESQQRKKRKSNNQDYEDKKKYKREAARYTADIVDLKALSSMKVPKKDKNSTDVLESVSIKSKEFMEDIRPLLVRSFKLRNSERSMRFDEAYFIHNSEHQGQFAKKRTELKKESVANELNKDALIETYAFYFIHGGTHRIKQMAIDGIQIGNLKKSTLGNPSMGVSLSQFADIYSDGSSTREGSMPRSGWLVVCKVLRGRVNYVQEDDSPMDPQPGYECHMSKTICQDFASTTLESAFHSTQMYLYEYNEDFDLADRPRHVLPYAAIKFLVTGPGLCLRIGVSRPVGRQAMDTSANGTASENAEETGNCITTASGLTIKPRRGQQQDRAGRPRLEGGIGHLVTTAELTIGGLPDWDIGVELVAYGRHLMPFDQLLHPNLELCELIRVDALHDQLCEGLSPNADGRRLVVQRDNETQLALEAEGQTYRLYYLRVVMTDADQYRAKLARLCSYLNTERKAAKVKMIYSKHAFCYVFPDGTFARTVGIPPAENSLDGNYLHMILGCPGTMDQYLAYYSSGPGSDEERLIADIWAENNTALPPSQDSSLNVHVFIQTIEQQSALQKARLVQLVKCAPTYMGYDEINYSPQLPPMITALQSVGKPVCEGSTGEAAPKKSRFSSAVEYEGHMEEEEDTKATRTSRGDEPYEPYRNLLGLSTRREEPVVQKVFAEAPASPEGSRVLHKSPEKPPVADTTAPLQEEIHQKLLEVVETLRHQLQQNPVIPREENNAGKLYNYYLEMMSKSKQPTTPTSARQPNRSPYCTSAAPNQNRVRHSPAGGSMDGSQMIAGLTILDEMNEGDIVADVDADEVARIEAVHQVTPFNRSATTVVDYGHGLGTGQSCETADVDYRMWRPANPPPSRYRMPASPPPARSRESSNYSYRGEQWPREEGPPRYRDLDRRHSHAPLLSDRDVVDYSDMEFSRFRPRSKR